MITKVEIRKAWPYYQRSGNIDLEHLTKKAGKTFQQYEKALFDNGFPLPKMSLATMRSYYEIGRPVPDSFDDESCSFLAEIYSGSDDVVAPANWFWKTITETSPPWNWKPSVGGSGRTVEVIVDNKDDVFGTHRVQKAELVKDFQWNNVGLTLEPMNHHVSSVQVVRKSILKGVDMTEENEIETVPVSEILKSVMLKSASSALEIMYADGQITQLEQIQALGDICKSIGDTKIPNDIEVSKSFDVSKAFGFGEVSTDRSLATDVWAGIHADWVEDAIHDEMAENFVKYTQKGITPLAKGYVPSEDGPNMDIAWMVMERFGCDEDSGLTVADLVIKALTAPERG